MPASTPRARQDQERPNEARNEDIVAPTSDPPDEERLPSDKERSDGSQVDAAAVTAAATPAPVTSDVATVALAEVSVLSPDHIRYGAPSSEPPLGTTELGWSCGTGNVDVAARPSDRPEASTLVDAVSSIRTSAPVSRRVGPPEVAAGPAGHPEATALPNLDAGDGDGGAAGTVPANGTEPLGLDLAEPTLPATLRAFPANAPGASSPREAATPAASVDAAPAQVFSAQVPPLSALPAVAAETSTGLSRSDGVGAPASVQAQGDARPAAAPEASGQGRAGPGTGTAEFQPQRDDGGTGQQEGGGARPGSELASAPVSSSTGGASEHAPAHVDVATVTSTGPASARMAAPPLLGVPEGARPDPVVADVPISRVAIEIGLKSLDGVNRFEIRLTPDDLGRVHVTLDIDSDGQVNAHLIADRPETLSFLNRDRAQLERAFEQAGLRAGDGGLAFSLRDGAGEGFGRGAPQGDRQPPPQGGRPAPETDRADPTLPRPAGSPSFGRPSSAGIDLRI